MAEDLNKKIDERIRLYAKTAAFTDRKVTDTPTDSLAVVNRKYITRNGATRPTTSIVGEQFFDTGLGQPIWWDGTSWVDAVASVV